MQILLDEDKRVLSTCEDEMEVQYPDERWIVISMSDDTVFKGDFIDNRWDGTQIIYDPKQILGGVAYKSCHIAVVSFEERYAA